MSDIAQVEDAKPKRQRRPRPAAPEIPRVAAVSQGWLILISYAPLQIVQTANYLRFGPNGVRRFGPGTPNTPPPHPHTIHIKITLKQMTGKVVTVFDNLTLRNPDAFDLEGMNIWSGKHEAAHLHVTWVWDFYRLLSGIRLALDLSRGADAGEAWKTAHESLRSLEAGAKVVVEASSLSGDIIQIYPFEGLLHG